MVALDFLATQLDIVFYTANGRSCHPPQQINLPGFGNTLMHSDNKQLAPVGGNNRRGRYAGGIQCLHPLQFRPQFRIAVITEAVNTHGKAAARSGIGNGENGIFPVF